MSDKRPPSKLGEIQPTTWPAEYTTELRNVLNVLGRLIHLEPQQAKFLDAICSGTLIDGPTVATALAKQPKPLRSKVGPSLFAD